MILASGARPRHARRRFSVAHELGHFLNPWHRTTVSGGFQCSRRDMRETDRQSQNPHRRQEAEANSFAIELLAPRNRIRTHLSGAADLGQILAMAGELDISREAAARRYVSLHDEVLAVLFSGGGVLRYVDRSTDFPALCIEDGQPVPDLPDGAAGSPLSAPDEVSPDDWLRTAPGIRLTAQNLIQRNGFAITLLRVLSEEEDDGIDDAFERFTRPGTRAKT